MSAGGVGSAYRLQDNGGLAEAERLRQQARLAIRQELKALLQSLPAGGRLLDLGCGTGSLCDAVADARPDAQVLGLDPDAMAIDEARRLFQRPNLAFEQRGVEDGPAHQGQAGDVVVLRLVLMHLPEVGQALKWLEAWLRPGGRLHVIEGDDRALALEPWPAGLDRVLTLMEQAQLARGGSRWRGLELAQSMQAAGWTVLGRSQSAPPEAEAARAVPAVFAPVAQFYLDEALRRGMVEPQEHSELSSILKNACERGFTRAHLPLFHVWGAAPGS
jgi:SAM-dependent methyltransferase